MPISCTMYLVYIIWVNFTYLFSSILAYFILLALISYVCINIYCRHSYVCFLRILYRIIQPTLTKTRKKRKKERKKTFLPACLPACLPAYLSTCVRACVRACVREWVQQYFPQVPNGVTFHFNRVVYLKAIILKKHLN